jgi:hypothetical protein
LALHDEPDTPDHRSHHLPASSKSADRNDFTDTTVTNGTTYYYAVNANGSWGVSNFSNVVTATP